MIFQNHGFLYGISIIAKYTNENHHMSGSTNFNS